MVAVIVAHQELGLLNPGPAKGLSFCRLTWSAINWLATPREDGQTHAGGQHRSAHFLSTSGACNHGSQMMRIRLEEGVRLAGLQIQTESAKDGVYAVDLKQ